MKAVHPHLEEVNIIGKLADLKSDHYQNTLVISALIELLVEKKVLTPEDIHYKIAELDSAVMQERPIS